MILFQEPTLADALCFFNTDTPNWWSWINAEDGEVYSNVQSNIDGVDVPSEDECNTKLEELQAIWDSQNADYVLARQMLTHQYMTSLMKFITMELILGKRLLKK